ncbi:MAG: toxin-antitoxin system YwqK family antitoxin [Elusimicrobiota bacterium]|jgi:antitoxin component YwqK of YwqJK toxin-antitoxin module|nr:toxin-antitoxin system YwqK family antitoxin [Elusimicrobiota bacterium]
MKEKSVIPTLEEQGKTYVTRFEERIFYIDNREIARQTLDIEGNIIDSSGEPFSGEAKEFYRGAGIKQNAFFKNGIIHGEVKTYDRQGRVISVENYENGFKEGEARFFNFTKGVLNEQKAQYLHGKLHGSRISYNLKGDIVAVENFKNGLLEGTSEIFYQSGAKQSSCVYKNDLVEGQKFFYYETGRIMYEENFKAGKLTGKRTGYYPDGKIYLEEFYENGLIDGERIVFEPDGTIRTKQFYRRAKLLQNEELPSRAGGKKGAVK